MRGLRRDLVISFVIALILNFALYGWVFFRRGGFHRIDASDDFRKISVGMTMPEVQQIVARDHATCVSGKDTYCHFQDLRRVYSVDFDREARVSSKFVQLRMQSDY